MPSLQALITTPLQWEKADSHVEGKVYPEGVTPKRDKFSIRPNTVVYEWTGMARSASTWSCRQYSYPESGVIVQLPNARFIYGDICRWVTDEINQDNLLKYMFGKKPHWNQVIFDSIDWRDMDSCMQKIAKQSGSMVTNVLKLVHGWQNDGQQKDFFYEDSDETLRPVGCGKLESRIHLIQCTAKHMLSGHIKWRAEFKQAHSKLRTENLFMRVVCVFLSSFGVGLCPQATLPTLTLILTK